MDSNTASLVVASLSAIAAFVSTLVAVAALYLQGSRSRTLLQIELLFKFNDRFSDEHFRNIRSAAAHELLTNAADLDAVDDVLDYFESMGLMMDHNALDAEMVWSEYSYWIDGWWCAASAYIHEVRSDDPTVWEYFRRMREKVMRVEKRWTKASDSELVLSRGDVEDFLRDEQSVNAVNRNTVNRGASRKRIRQKQPKQKGASSLPTPSS